MSTWIEDGRFPVHCAECGAVYVGAEVADGDIRPLGPHEECTECGTAEFLPRTEATEAELSGESD